MTLTCAQSSEYPGGLVKIPIAGSHPQSFSCSRGRAPTFYISNKSPHDAMLWSEPHFIN